MTTTRLREVQSEDFTTPQPDVQSSQQASNASLQLLILALKTLSQRFVVALAALRGMILAGTVFWLAFTVCQSPDTPKLVGLGLYSGFILLSELILIRRK